MAALLRGSPWGFDVLTAGPEGELGVREALALPGVVLYAQPGGSGDDETAFRRQRRNKGAIRRFVAAGGRYLGICMGGYLAEPGFFNLFPGRVDEYFSSKGALVRTDEPALVDVLWRGEPREMYFQDGGFVVPHRRAVPDMTVLARYRNGPIAAAVAPFGDGKVAVCGPHPEAPAQWYRNAHLRFPEPTADLGTDLLESLMG
ncbi:hypothetical protein I4I78_15315 [Pseudonocardia sp. KRD-291]|nr:hypothetical protein [Pseudonocardia sp. KRD291]